MRSLIVVKTIITYLLDHIITYIFNFQYEGKFHFYAFKKDVIKNAI